MPPRQPPRPAPKPAKAPKSSGKGAARGGAKGGAKTKGGPRKAAPPPKGKQQPRDKKAANAEQQRQQRVLLDQQRRQREATWWAVNQVAMNRLHSSQHHAAGGEAIGTILNGDRRLRWRTSHAVGAITLLILTAFFTSMALGAQSIGIGLLAFLCLAGFIAVVTVEYSARRFPEPVPAPPLIGEHRLEDLIVEDDPPRPKSDQDEATTLDVLDDLFVRPGNEPPAAAPAPAPEPPPPAPEPEPPAAETKIEIPAPPRPRAAAEPPATIPDDLSDLLLSEQSLEDTDVADVAATLVVGDLQRSLEFYSEALGLTVADRTDEAAVLEAGFGKILLWERPDAPPGETGVMHLTFEVGDLDATFAEMNAAGVEFLHLPRTALLGQHYELRAAAFRDPDGHGLAITEHRER